MSNFLIEKYQSIFILYLQAMFICLVLVFLSGILSPVVIIGASTELRNATFETFNVFGSTYMEFINWLTKTSRAVEPRTTESQADIAKNGNILKEKNMAKDEICTIKCIVEKANEVHALGQERWAFERSDKRPLCINTTPTDLIVSSTEKKLTDGDTLEKVHSLVSLGVRSKNQYDPVNDIQDFTTTTFEDNSHKIS